jgi:hypothetical protein
LNFIIYLLFLLLQQCCAAERAEHRQPAKSVNGQQPRYLLKSHGDMSDGFKNGTLLNSVE